MEKSPKQDNDMRVDFKANRNVPSHHIQGHHSAMRAHILLTTVCRPFGRNGEGDSVGAELFHAQVTREQGMFSYRQVIRCWGLDYIAENIQTPSVVLHYPSEQELIKELKNQAYEYVGINFVVATFHKLRRVTQLVRRHAPGAKIILGGYGTVLSDDELLPHGDLICRQEGIGFMRRLLGEDTDRPIVHPYTPIESPRIYSVARKTKVAHITAGLGCPNGCDFCCTSHFFKRKYVPFVRSGRRLYEIMLDMKKQAQEAGDALSGFIIIDEDFLLHETRAREFLQCVRENGECFSIMGFASVRGLSQFTADEIAEMGFDIIWTGFEAKEADFKKLQGRPLPELYSSLRSRGVAILSSMIIGFPYQDKAKVLEEFRMFTQLRPSFWQILIYFAFPGTPLHRRMLAENRFLPEYSTNPDYRTFDGFSMHFRHPHFSASELKDLQRELYRKSFEILGPSLLQVIRVWFEACRNLSDSSNPLLKNRARRMRKYVRNAVPALYPIIFFGPNKGRRDEAKALLHEIIQETGSLSVKERLLCLATVPLSLWTWFTNKLDISQQPRLTRIQYPGACVYKDEDKTIELGTSCPVDSQVPVA
jgi:haloalkane dehalogenase